MTTVDPKTVLKKIRTYADDLEYVRKINSQTKKETNDEAIKVPEIPVPEKTKGDKTLNKAIPKPKTIKVEKLKVTPRKIKKTVVDSSNKENKKQIPTPISVPEKKPKKLAASTKIPAFHELQREVSSINKKNSKEAAEKKEMPKKNQEPIKRLSNSSVGYDSTIITDTKKDRFKLFPAIGKSFSNWQKNLFKKKKSPIPTYTIPDTDRRKDVIQKATTKTGSVFTADNKQLKEQIRLRQQKSASVKNEGSEQINIPNLKTNTETEAVPEPINITKVPAIPVTSPEPSIVQQPDEPKTTWSPYTDSGYNLLEEPEKEHPKNITNVTLEFKQTPTQTNITDSDETGPLPEPLEHSNPTTFEIEKEFSFSENSEPYNNAVSEMEIKKNTEDTEKEPSEDTVDFEEIRWKTVAQKAASQPKKVEKSEAKESTWSAPRIKQNDPRTIPETKSITMSTNTLTIVMVTSVIVVVLLIVGVRIIYNTLTSETEVSQTTFETKALLPGSVIENIIITPSEIDKLASIIIESVPSSTGSVVEMPIISPTGEELSSAYLFQLLKLNASPGLRQSITSTRFVTFGQKTPALVMTYVDRTTVLGSMLAWESNMARDFSVIYNLPDSTDKFLDYQIKNIDVRALKSEDETILLYGLVTDNTMVIARHEDDFAQLVDLIKPE